MSAFVLRLDDASENMDVKRWDSIVSLCNSYNVKPIIAVIPCNEDPDLVEAYAKSDSFWDTVWDWSSKGYEIAMHGCTHQMIPCEGGLNPVNPYTEFSGLSLEEQKYKIRRAWIEFKKHGIEPRVFVAPAHTFDENTLIALRDETGIRIISDTVATNVYTKQGFWFIPQQTGRCRNLPFQIVTFCYHPNTMTERDFSSLEVFFAKNRDKFLSFADIELIDRAYSIIDRAINAIYFARRK